MKLKSVLGWSSALCLSAYALQAQETKSLDDVQKQLQQMQDNFNKVVQEQQKKIEELNRQVQDLKKAQVAPPTNAPMSAATTNAPPGAASATNAVGQIAGATPPVPEKKPWSPSDPIRVLGGSQSYMNISFDGLFAVGTSTTPDVEALEFGGHDPKQRGFTVQNLELTLDGKVDHYFRGQANIVLQIDPDGETTIEAEEAYLESLSLPWNLQVKAGQYFTQFGRINPTHPHTWDFVDQPLVVGRFLGPDGLRNPGAQISWLAPTPFYSELFFSVQNSQGETAYSFRDSEGAEMIAQRPAVDTSVNNLGDMLYAPRYVMSFNLGDEHTVVLGASAAFGPNASGENTDTLIYGADLFYKWKPKNQSKGFPFVTWQTELMFNRYEAGAFAGDATSPPLPAQTLRNWGMYSQVSYGFHRGWVASLRGDYVTGEPGDFFADPVLDNRYRISPALTYYPSEFSKIRLQYNYDHIQNTGPESSVWLQFEFLLGAHAAHKF
jgi:hypothetical protein